MSEQRNILVLGASGLIGRFVTDDLRLRGRTVIGIARRYSASQRRSASDLEIPILAMTSGALARLIRDNKVGVIVNCLGVLQDGPGSDTRAVHRDFVAGLVQAIHDSGQTLRLIHVSIPGTAGEDRTAFSLTKREAEGLIAASGIGYAILRPGFVIAPSAYGGSAIVRALAALPFDLPASEAATPFQPVAASDIAETIAFLAGRDIDDEATRAVAWDLMQPQKISLSGVVAQFRFAFGSKDFPRITVPKFLLDLGAKLGDLSSWFGWMPPMRSTAIAELRRGITGNPSAWMAGLCQRPSHKRSGSIRRPFRTNGSRGCFWSSRSRSQASRCSGLRPGSSRWSFRFRQPRRSLPDTALRPGWPRHSPPPPA